MLYSYAWISGMPISAWYNYLFWQTYSPKTVSVDDVIFSNCNFEHFRHRTEIKMPFLEFRDQTGLETHILCSKIAIWKFGFMWPRADLSLLCPWLAWSPLQNGFDFWILRAKVTINNVPHARKGIFYSGDLSLRFMTWPQPWPVLSMTLMLAEYL